MSDLPYVVSGQVTDSNGTNPSGVRVVARNDRTIENINVTLVESRLTETTMLL